MKLSPHFTLAELCVTSTGLANEPTPEHLAALRVTAYGMEIVRHILGDEPIKATSGYRNPVVNKAVGGVSNSDHALGYACDFRHGRLSSYDAAKLIVASPLVFDQLILERNNTLIHLSFNPRLRMQVLRQPGGPGSKCFQGLD
jgi:zinc D-Ala-D-Ala carboxypeptidase